VLGWPPAAFWTATPWEFWAAFDGWRRVNCITPPGGPLDAEERARLDEMKRRFPDA
jgi:hypothetical protein